ncbi:hypothetical protein D5086_000774 [Populus alba]|uniref:Uncharacterized protein n=2 Tax=Populus TaxID=3689 RepID=A0ACC4CXJ3_POPAL
MEAIEQRMGGDGDRVGGSRGAGSAHGGEIEKYYGGRGGFGREDFGRGDFRLPPPRAYEYSDQYNGDYNRGESGYGMPRRTRSYRDMSEMGGGEGREEKKTTTSLRGNEAEEDFWEDGTFTEVAG